jgi:hypothetical protein
MWAPGMQLTNVSSIIIVSWRDFENTLENFSVRSLHGEWTHAWLNNDSNMFTEESLALFCKEQKIGSRWVMVMVMIMAMEGSIDDQLGGMA